MGREDRHGGARFDAAYYERFYLDPSTRVSDDKQTGHLASAVVSLIEWFGGELKSVLDVGAGVGRWGAWLRANRPGVSIVSTEMDPDVCRRYGHERRDITQWRSKRRFDLVICQGVLPYLDDRGAAAAIENLAAMSNGFLYLEAITKRDLREVCDLSRTDARVHARTATWYRARLRPHYRTVGAGLFYSRRGALEFYDLEAGR